MSTDARASVTLVRDPIQRPDEPRHFMVLRRLSGVATARVGDTAIARSERAIVVKEVGYDIYDPVIYFPPGDVRAERLMPIAKRTQCPLKGTAAYFHVDAGGTLLTEAAWSYQQILELDARASQLEGCVAFDRARVTVEVEGDGPFPSTHGDVA